MTTQTDTLNKEQAAALLGVSDRTPMSLTGKRIAHLPKPRESDPTLYSRDELERHRRPEEDAPGYVSPVVTPDTPDTPVGPHSLARRNDAEHAASVFARIIAGAQNGRREPSISDLACKLLLTECEAALYPGPPLAEVRAARKALKTAKHGRAFKPKREVLEAWVRKL